MFLGVVETLSFLVLNRRVRKLRRFLEPLRWEIVPELVGEPETLIVDSTLLEVLHPHATFLSRRAGEALRPEPHG